MILTVPLFAVLALGAGFGPEKPAAEAAPGRLHGGRHLTASWGMCIHDGDLGNDVDTARRAFDMIVDLGCRFIRTDFSWMGFELDRDVWNEDYIGWISDLTDAALEKGLQVQALLSSPPDWAVALYGSDRDQFLDEYTEYCAEVARRFKDRIYYYQIWNEAENPEDFIPQGEEWRLFPAGRKGLELEDGDFESIVNIGGGIGWEPYLDDWLGKAGDSIDIIGLDTYPGTHHPGPYDNVSDLKTLLNKTTDPLDACYGKKVMIEETGFSTYKSGHTQVEQREWINDALSAFRDVIDKHNSKYPNKFLSCCWYELLDADTSGPGDVELRFGILETDWTPKLGYSDLRAQIAAYGRDTSTFYFAEDTCRPGFDPYICIQNPGEEDAEVRITYMLGDGTTREETLTVLRHSRSTVAVKNLLGEGDDPAHDFSARVESTKGRVIIAERPQYFRYHGDTPGGHVVVGL